jgi:GNAT superfamily N-acetyltransferase
MALRDGLMDIPAGKIAAVVTSLEMRERAKPRPAVSEPSWRLRYVVEPDTAWYRDLYRRIGEAWLWFSRLNLSDAELAETIQDPRVEVYALDRDGADEGLLELDFRDGDCCELSFFGVTPSMLGRGAGRWLMNQAIERAWSRPIGQLWLHTCTMDHPGALDFYVRSGFRPFRRQVEVVDDPRLVGTFPTDAAPHVPII